MKINDTKLYLYSTIVTFVVALILGAVSYYSILKVEPESERLINAQDNFSDSYRKAYAMLRDPQIFARYENFDRESRWIKTTVIPYMDNKIYNSREFTPDEKVYLEALLNRRKQGSVLGRNTMVFFLLISVLGLGFYLYERRKVKREEEPTA
ncbi:MAG: hypothetical protein KBA61_17105 [Spirochaetes bacterium]|nr:hypothetical protein [Spirochaetota bacterium]HPA70954.1 hypothetical protein [Spirochaetota bacterium]